MMYPHTYPMHILILNILDILQKKDYRLFPSLEIDIKNISPSLFPEEDPTARRTAEITKLALGLDT